VADVFAHQLFLAFPGTEAATVASFVDDLVVADVDVARVVPGDDIGENVIDDAVGFRLRGAVRGLQRGEIHIVVIGSQLLSGGDPATGEEFELPGGVFLPERTPGDAFDQLVVPARLIGEFAVLGPDDHRSALRDDQVAVRESHRVRRRGQFLRVDFDAFRTVRIFPDHAVGPAQPLNQRSHFDAVTAAEREKRLGGLAVLFGRVVPPVVLPIPARFDDAEVDFEPRHGAHDPFRVRWMPETHRANRLVGMIGDHSRQNLPVQGEHLPERLDGVEGADRLQPFGIDAPRAGNQHISFVVAEHEFAGGSLAVAQCFFRAVRAVDQEDRIAAAMEGAVFGFEFKPVEVAEIFPEQLRAAVNQGIAVDINQQNRGVADLHRIGTVREECPRFRNDAGRFLCRLRGLVRRRGEHRLEFLKNRLAVKPHPGIAGVPLDAGRIIWFVFGGVAFIVADRRGADENRPVLPRRFLDRHIPVFHRAVGVPLDRVGPLAGMPGADAGDDRFAVETLQFGNEFAVIGQKHIVAVALVFSQLNDDQVRCDGLDFIERIQSQGDFPRHPGMSPADVKFGLEPLPRGDAPVGLVDEVVLAGRGRHTPVALPVEAGRRGMGGDAVS